ncbi:hypothetical protein, partial [Escherichia coli]|uniref:hypothetical protein n=1 Tax=Escherichia coli TaxID=562 RepID=UPI003CE51B49
VIEARQNKTNPGLQKDCKSADQEMRDRLLNRHEIEKAVEQSAAPSVVELRIPGVDGAHGDIRDDSGEDVPFE